MTNVSFFLLNVSMTKSQELNVIALPKFMAFKQSDRRKRKKNEDPL